MKTALEEALRAVTGSEVRVENLQAMAGGASQEMWRLDASVDGGEWRGEHALVLRWQLGGKIYREALDLAREFRVIQAAYGGQVPVARPFWFIADLLGRPALLMQRLDGETIGRRIVKEASLEEARKKLPAQMAHALAQIHKLDVAPLRDILPQPNPDETPAQWLIGQLEKNLDEIDEPHPALELGLRWLRVHEPKAPEQLTVNHGDFRIGNVIVNPEGLVGVLDWEFAHIGDPAEDLAWGCVRDWRFGMDSKHFGGLGEPEDFFAAYQNDSGRMIDPARIFYWEVFGNVRWAVGALNQARRHLSGEEPNLEFASLGRRCAEMEFEVLHLIES